MKIADCPYCERELEIDDSYSLEIEDIDKAINRVAGHCPICNREFQWEEIYEYSHFSNLEEIC